MADSDVVIHVRLRGELLNAQATLNRLMAEATRANLPFTAQVDSIRTMIHPHGTPYLALSFSRPEVF